MAVGIIYRNMDDSKGICITRKLTQLGDSSRKLHHGSSLTNMQHLHWRPSAYLCTCRTVSSLLTISVICHLAAAPVHYPWEPLLLFSALAQLRFDDLEPHRVHSQALGEATWDLWKGTYESCNFLKFLTHESLINLLGLLGLPLLPLRGNISTQRP